MWRWGIQFCYKYRSFHLSVSIGIWFFYKRWHHQASFSFLLILMETPSKYTAFPNLCPWTVINLNEINLVIITKTYWWLFLTNIRFSQTHLNLLCKTSHHILPTAMKLKDAYSLEAKLWPTKIAYWKAETLLWQQRFV